MGLYKVVLPFTRNGKEYGFGDTVNLPDAEPEEFRNVGMLLHYGIIDAAPQENPQPDEKSDAEQK